MLRLPTKRAYFGTTGTADPGFWGTPNGSPNSEGMIFEVAYFGEPDTPFRTLKVRFTPHHVDYLIFNRTLATTRDNNNFYLSAWTALRS